MDTLPIPDPSTELQRALTSKFRTATAAEVTPANAATVLQRLTEAATQAARDAFAAWLLHGGEARRSAAPAFARDGTTYRYKMSTPKKFLTKIIPTPSRGGSTGPRCRQALDRPAGRTLGHGRSIDEGRGASGGGLPGGPRAAGRSGGDPGRGRVVPGETDGDVGVGGRVRVASTS